METFCIKYLDTEHRLYTIFVEAEDADDAVNKAIDQANESYHGFYQLVSIS